MLYNLTHAVPAFGATSRHYRDRNSLRSALRISDPRSHEASKAVAIKAQKQFWASNGIRTHDLRDTGAVLYRLSYEASLEAGQERWSLRKFFSGLCLQLL